jgi:thiol-disulfide isomerase/thioredoxin
MNLSEIHDCEKCHDKGVMIETDMFGNTYCGYCHQPVNYKPFFEEALKKHGINMGIEKMGYNIEWCKFCRRNMSHKDGVCLKHNMVNK